MVLPALFRRTMMRSCLGKETRIVDQHLQFLSSYLKEEMSGSHPCHEFGISVRLPTSGSSVTKKSDPRSCSTWGARRLVALTRHRPWSRTRSLRE